LSAETKGQSQIKGRQYARAITATIQHIHSPLFVDSSSSVSQRKERSATNETVTESLVGKRKPGPLTKEDTSKKQRAERQRYFFHMMFTT
jgi:hypothetical protein